jgi:hypothetical protein
MATFRLNVELSTEELVRLEACVSDYCDHCAHQLELQVYSPDDADYWQRQLDLASAIGAKIEENFKQIVQCAHELEGNR